MGVSGELCLSHVFKEKCGADTKAPRLDLSPSGVMRAIKLESLVTAPMTRAVLDTDRAFLAENCSTKNSSREENKRLCKLSNVFIALFGVTGSSINFFSMASSRWLHCI